MKTTLTSFAVLILAFAFFAIGVITIADAPWVEMNLDLAVALSIVFGVFASAAIIVIDEPVQGSPKSILPSNI